MARRKSFTNFLIVKYKNLSQKLLIAGLLITFFVNNSFAQWRNVSEQFAPLPNTLQVYYTDAPLSGRAFQAYYAIIHPSENLQLDMAVGKGNRYTPQEFYQQENNPLLVVNTTFFSFDTHQNLNLVVKKGKLVAYNVPAIPIKETDSFYYPLAGAFGIDKKGRKDIAWTFTDSAKHKPFAIQTPPTLQKGFKQNPTLKDIQQSHKLKKWKMRTAVAGGPVLVQNHKALITNVEERKFVTGLNDLHPRTAIGYRSDGAIIVVVVAGRMPGIAEGISLKELSDLMIGLGCEEALNLDGGGSSCMLINGKETIKPSSNGEQRPVPAVLTVKMK